MRGYVEFRTQEQKVRPSDGNSLWEIGISSRHIKAHESFVKGTEPVVTIIEINVFAETETAAVSKLADIFGADWESDWSVDHICRLKPDHDSPHRDGNDTWWDNSPDHVCGLRGYCPGPPHFDPICPACSWSPHTKPSER